MKIKFTTPSSNFFLMQNMLNLDDGHFVTAGLGLDEWEFFGIIGKIMSHE